jgi:uncharacterized LabA/DUF88 family protein
MLSCDLQVHRSKWKSSLSSRIALLIDAENISHKDLPEILQEVPRHGEVILRAIYGDWQQPSLQKWYQLAREHQLKIRHQPNGAKIKNSSDIKLMLDAMEVLLWTPAEVFCLVTNDADYVPLCHKLRESRKSIIGVGYPHAAEAFIRACDQFIFIGRETPPVNRIIEPPKLPSAAKPTAPPQAVDQKPLQKLLSKAFAAVRPDADGWVNLSALDAALRKVQPNFTIKTYGCASLTKFLQTMPDFVDLRTQGTTASARLKHYTVSQQIAPEKPTKLLQKAFAAVRPDADGWVNLSALDAALRKVQPNFTVKAYGRASLTKFLQTMPNFVDLRTHGTTASARLKK